MMKKPEQPRIDKMKRFASVVALAQAVSIAVEKYEHNCNNYETFKDSQECLDIKELYELAELISSRFLKELPAIRIISSNIAKKIFVVDADDQKRIENILSAAVTAHELLGEIVTDILNSDSCKNNPNGNEKSQIIEKMIPLLSRTALFYGEKL